MLTRCVRACPVLAPLRGHLRAASTTSNSYDDFLAVAKAVHAKGESPYTYLPSTFKVPKDPAFPDYLRGEVLNFLSIRQKHKHKKLPPHVVQALDAIWFVWDISEHKSKLRIDALTAYKAVFGNVLVPRSFKVPSGDANWPKHTWGLSLGAACHNIRTGGLAIHPSHQDEFTALGFVWDASTARSELNLAAAAHFRLLFGHALIPLRYTVPADDPSWPKPMHGLGLGNAVRYWRARASSLSPERRAFLDALGFVWEPMDAKWQMDLEAVTIYQHLHGHTIVPKRYVVPSNSSEWPADLWGHRLGSLVHTLRVRMDEMSTEHRDELDAIGFTWDPLEFHWDMVVAALRTFHAIHGHMRITTSFRVPTGDARWPDEMWDLHLGSLVTQIRHRADLMATEQAEILATILLEDEDEDGDDDDDGDEFKS
ncbi:Aste57867_13219 [Aphanomyces stellatus]|uniref:Aste57867_13219 protein n=1 Tax=Aphanomyces stellatus TaxID=120398 RepID=A0A485KZ91_9STRA|nr:hypothetical protein As57867_013170 [Aphanomyces stellatus]VFT90059.1 Aste57867_13219 [Aphanomyces stellatus]